MTQAYITYFVALITLLYAHLNNIFRGDPGGDVSDVHGAGEMEGPRRGKTILLPLLLTTTRAVLERKQGTQRQ